MPFTLLLQRGSLIVLLLALSACGWQLRGIQSDSAIPDLRLHTHNTYAPLVISFRHLMRDYGIQEKADAALSVHLDTEKLEKRTVAVTSIGSSAQYELLLSAKYSIVQNTTQTVAEQSHVQSVRIFDFEPGNNVAKTEEENTLLDEMRQELAAKILTRVQRLEGSWLK